MTAAFSFGRFWAVLVKEFVQMRRDRLTFAMMVGVPVLQLLLFGYAINADPKSLPAAVVMGEASPFARSFLAGLTNSGYFRIVGDMVDEAGADAMLARGEVQFVVTVPADFSRRIARGERPQILVEADATDPAATSNALAALPRIAETAAAHDLGGALGALAPRPGAFDLVVHRRYNAEGVTAY
ncbi:ABC transporter permease, partial [Stella sp.]|uniref:ABC transporter permease n=1 Tax=Stella sp. TaxID=2912054 RepID=UPI0035B2ACC1